MTRKGTAAVAALSLSLGLGGLADAAAAATISIEVPGADKVSKQTVDYTCGGKTVTVEYINAGSVSLAVLKFEDDFVVASNVVAGSGARYVGGPYEWWSKGQTDATLSNLMSEDQSPLSCQAKS